MRENRFRYGIACITLIHYLLLVAVVPVFHRHDGMARALACGPEASALLSSDPVVGAVPCPACDWEQVGQTIPVPPPAGGTSDLLVSRSLLPEALYVPSSSFNLHSPRGPPTATL